MSFIYTFPAAIGLGALHSLKPGHGKGVISLPYFLGSKIKDA